jgi:hypothetical protein
MFQFFPITDTLSHFVLSHQLLPNHPEHPQSLLTGLLGSPPNAQMVSVEPETRHYFCVLHEQEGNPAVFKKILCVLELLLLVFFRTVLTVGQWDNSVFFCLSASIPQR